MTRCTASFVLGVAGGICAAYYSALHLGFLQFEGHVHSPHKLFHSKESRRQERQHQRSRVCPLVRAHPTLSSLTCTTLAAML